METPPSRSSVSSVTSGASTRSVGSGKNWHFNRTFYNYVYTPETPEVEHFQIQVRKTLSGHFRRVTSLAFITESTFVSCSQDSRLIVWNCDSGLKTHWANLSSDVLPLACAVDALQPTSHKYIAVGGMDNTVSILNIEKIMSSSSLSPLSSDNSPMHTDNETKKKKEIAPVVALHGHNAMVNALVWSDGNKVVVSASADGTAITWDVATGTQTQTFGHGHGHGQRRVCDVRDVTIMGSGNSNGGDSSMNNIFITAGSDGACRVYDVRRSREAALTFSEPAAASPSSPSISSSSAAINCVSPFPAGNSFMSGGEDGVARVWDIRCSDSLTCIESDERGCALNTCRFSRSGRFAFLGYADGKLRVYDLTRQERAPPMRSSDALRVFTSHAGGVNCLAVSPDGRHVVSGGDDAVCKVMA